MEWQTYKWCRFHRSGRGSLARRRRARPRERRPSRHDSETPLCHTRWRLRWQEQKSGGKEGKMQHEVMIGKQADHMINRMQMLFMEPVTDKSRLPAV